MSNSEHVALLRRGVAEWNRWREENPGVLPDLSKAELQHQVLIGADLHNVDLSGASLMAADLTRAQLRDSNLRHVKINDARAWYADFRRCNMSAAYLWGSDFREADFSEADLSHANLRNCQLVMTKFSGADISGCKVYGIAAWDIDLLGAKQFDLVINAPNQPDSITVDNLEVAQFVYLLLNNKKLRDVLDTITAKVILILGRFTPERKPILDLIRDHARGLDLVPVMFDFEPLTNKTTMETVASLANLARFIIADVTDAKSVVGELERVVGGLPSLPVQLILQDGATAWGMVDDILSRESVLPLVRYRDTKDVACLLPQILTAVDARAKARAAKLAEVRAQAG